MGIPMLTQCCCGCTLKTGSIIIAVLNIMGGICFLGIGIVFCSHDWTIEEDDDDDALVIAGAIMARSGVVALLAGISLFIGAMKEIPVLLIPYMVLTSVSAAVEVLAKFIAAADYYGMGNSTQGTSQNLGLILGLLLQTYFILVVYSLYKEQKRTVVSKNLRRGADLCFDEELKLPSSQKLTVTYEECS